MMDLTSMIDPKWKIEKIEFVSLDGERPSEVESNARLGTHGKQLGVSTMRIHFGGKSGFGRSIIQRNRAYEWLGMSVLDLFDEFGLIKPEFYGLEYPVIDCLGKHFEMPVYKMFQNSEAKDGYKVPYYDSTIYFLDLGIDDDREAVRLMQERVSMKMARGHRHFKMKLGRGAMHMPLMKGIQRDIAMTKAVREIIGKDACLMIDANNGYNVNISKEVLSALKYDYIYWIEEPFQEDDAYLRNLKEWLYKENIDTLIADGEGGTRRSPHLLRWAREGLIDVLQYDILWDGFTYWLRMAKILDRYHIKSAPHNFGSPFGNYTTAQIYPYIKNFTFIEWDESEVPGLDFSAYVLSGGYVSVPDKPGFGIGMDEGYYIKQVSKKGWVIT